MFYPLLFLFIEIEFPRSPISLFPLCCGGGGGAMQSSTELIMDWLKKEMGYRPLGGHHYDGLPSPESLRNMVPVFNFLLNRVKSEKTVEKIRRDILFHGGGWAEEVGNGRGGKGGKPGKEKGSRSVEAALESSKEAALREREAAEREVRRLRMDVMRKELQSKMVEASREEADRKRLLDERENCRHKQVILEAYSEQCNGAAMIFAKYKYENNRVVDAVLPGVRASLQYQMYGTGKTAPNSSATGTHHQLFERQKAHVQQFLETEDALDKAAEAREISQNLIKLLHGSSLGSLRQFELDVMAKEREAAGLRASVNKLMAEVQRLKNCVRKQKNL